MSKLQTQEKRLAIMNMLSMISGALAIFCCFQGILNEKIYTEVLDSGAIVKNLVWGSMAQDIVSLAVAGAMLFFAIFNLRRQSDLNNIVILGCNWYFMYAYGLYVFQGMYTALYPLYLIIFSLSVYSMIAGLTSLSPGTRQTYEENKSLFITICVFLQIIVVILTPAWFGQMMNDVSTRIPGDTYAVYIMDLGIVFPAFIITVFMIFKKRSPGIALAGISLIKIFTLCLSWSFGEWTQIVKAQALNMPMALISSVLCLTSLLLLYLYFRAVKNTSKY